VRGKSPTAALRLRLLGTSRRFAGEESDLCVEIASLSVEFFLHWHSRAWHV
jgi:hypothetical protein